MIPQPGQTFTATNKLNEKHTYTMIGKGAGTYPYVIEDEEKWRFGVEEEWFNQRKIKVLS